MRGRMRIHIMAVGTITAVVLVMYLIVGPKSAPEQKTEFTGTNYVQVNSATWGMNCNRHIEYRRKEAEMKRAEVPYAEREKIEMPELVIRNNVLSQMSTLCNGKEVCAFRVESEVIGVDPVYACFKELEISYRCFEIDRLRQEKYRQGSTARIDCSPKAIDAK